MPLLLRPVRLSDAPELHQAHFPEQLPERAQDYLRWCVRQMEKGRMVRLVAEIGGQVVGNGQLSIHHRQGEIGSLIVAPSHRRRGIGNALLLALIAEARERGLHEVELAVGATTPWVRAWYERRGFSFVEERVLPGDERVAVLRMTLSSTEGSAEPQRR